MRIHAISIAENARLSTHKDRLADACLKAVEPGFNAVYGPTGAGKSVLVDFVAHTLYGRSNTVSSVDASASGELIVDSRPGRYQLRRVYDGGYDETTDGLLTAVAIDGSTVDPTMQQRWFSGFSPATVSQFYAVDFRERPHAERCRIEVLASELDALGGEIHEKAPPHLPDCDYPCTRRARMPRRGLSVERRNELFNRRDALAHELETRIADERRHGLNMDDECHRMDESIDEQQRELVHLRDRLRDVETGIAEIEIWRRCYRPEETVDVAVDPVDWKARLAELDEQIDRWEATLADLRRREANVREQLTATRPDDRASVETRAEWRAQLALSRRLASELQREVERLARSTESDRCVCVDAYPRLRPMVETIQNHLGALNVQLGEYRHAELDEGLHEELLHVVRSQDALRGQFEYLIRRRDELALRSKSVRRVMRSVPPTEHVLPLRDGASLGWSELDESSTERRLNELEQERDRLRDRLSEGEAELRKLHEQRDTLDRQRAGLLFAHEVERIQQELDAVQRELLYDAAGPIENPPATRTSDGLARASEFVSRLTNAELVRIQFVHDGLSAVASSPSRIEIINRTGERIAIESLSAAERDQVCLGICLAGVSICRRRGVRLPMLLDEPFSRQDARGCDAVADVLAHCCGDGQQILVFTGKRSAAQRLGACGAAMHDLTTAPQRLVVRQQELLHQPRFTRSHPVEVVEFSEHDKFHTHVSASIRDLSDKDVEAEHLLASLGLQTIGDLLDADPDEIVRRLDRQDVSAETIERWQAYAAWMCFVPDVALDDARLLVGAGVMTPEHLLDVDKETHYQNIEEHLASDRGRRFRGRYDRRQLRSWIRGARRHRDRWRRSNHWRRWSDRRSQGRRSRNGEYDGRRSAVREGRRPRTKAVPSSSRSSYSAGKRDRESDATPRSWRFYLDPTSRVDDAPSIGPKTAERLAAIGIQTVADLLATDADAAARRIDARHITASAIREWQQQAQLVCRIPELRGHDAQILVACGLTNPEEIAAMDSDALLDRVTPFCNSKQGERIIRSGKKPDQGEVNDWITWASHRRALSAA